MPLRMVAGLSCCRPLDLAIGLPSYFLFPYANRDTSAPLASRSSATSPLFVQTGFPEPNENPPVSLCTSLVYTLMVAPGCNTYLSHVNWSSCDRASRLQL